MVLLGPGCKFLRGEPVEARMGSVVVVQLDDPTPTIRLIVGFFTSFTRGVVAMFALRGFCQRQGFPLRAAG